jgi:hypothetical protein
MSKVIRIPCRFYILRQGEVFGLVLPVSLIKTSSVLASTFYLLGGYMATLTELINSTGIKLKLVKHIPGQSDWGTPNHGYRLRLTLRGKSFTFPFYQGLGIKHNPEIVGVLECLLSDATVPDLLGGFVEEFGYDDIKKATKIYNACMRIRAKMQALLGPDFEAFVYADRE